MIGGVAFFLRLVVLFQISGAPSFLVPVIDEQSYDALARAIVAGQPWSEVFFWQPFFYPFFLGILYSVTSGSVLAARVVQVLIGALTAVLTARLGERIGGRTVGLAAGLIVALYGPLIFSEMELLATGWEVFWGVALLLMGVWLFGDSPPRTIWFAVFGVVCGASILTRPTFFPFVLVALGWLLFGQLRLPRTRRRAIEQGVWILVGLLVTLLPVAMLNAGATGTFSFLPYSGGINLHIGNNLEVGRTLHIRPGPDWQRFAGQPMEHGFLAPYARQDFFLGLVREYVAEHPGHFLAGILKKLVQFLGSYEIPRNIDMYVYRAYSPVLAALMWHVGMFGFPFAPLFALAVVGAVFEWKRFPTIVRLFLLVVPLAVVVVFVSARYRMVMIPVLAIAAALGVLAIVRFWKERSWPRLAAAGGLIVGSLVVTTLPNPYPDEPRDYTSEMLTWVATVHLEQGRTESAEPLLTQAVQKDPRNKTAWNALGAALTNRGDLQRAALSLDQALAIDPAYALAHQNYARLALSVGDYEGALGHLRRALAADPFNHVALENVAMLFEQRGILDSAAFYHQRAAAMQRRGR